METYPSAPGRRRLNLSLLFGSMLTAIMLVRLWFDAWSPIEGSAFLVGVTLLLRGLAILNR